MFVMILEVSKMVHTLVMSNSNNNSNNGGGGGGPSSEQGIFEPILDFSYRVDIPS